MHCIEEPNRLYWIPMNLRLSDLFKADISAQFAKTTFDPRPHNLEVAEERQARHLVSGRLYVYDAGNHGDVGKCFQLPRMHAGDIFIGVAGE